MTLRSIILPFALTASTLLTPAAGYAQSLDLPRPSPTAKVSQTVGLTDVAIEYSSPGVKNRKIFGGLVPYDKVWRTGANAATKITFSKESQIGGKTVPAGTYALLTIPGAAKWTVILSKDANAGEGSYKQENDLARVEVKPAAITKRERLTFIFSNTTDDTTSLDLEWDRTRVSIPLRTNTAAQALENIKNATEGAWRTYNSAARYMLETKKDYDAALKFADQSIAMSEQWFNIFTKAEIAAAKGNTKEAVDLAKRAQDIGNKNPAGFFFADRVKESIETWSKKGK